MSIYEIYWPTCITDEATLDELIADLRWTADELGRMKADGVQLDWEGDYARLWTTDKAIADKYRLRLERFATSARLPLL